MVAVAITGLTGCKNEPAPGDPIGLEEVEELPDWIDDEAAAESDACAVNPFWDRANMATRLFAGTFAFNGDGVVGKEVIYLYPNATLTENTGFTDCRLVWNVSGVKTEPIGVGTYGIALTGLIDEEETDCVEDYEGRTVYGSEDQFTVAYDVLAANGTATVLYGETGTRLGEGTADDRTMAYLSEPGCWTF